MPRQADRHLRQPALTSLIQQLFNADKAKSDDPPKNLADWELNPANTVITIGRADQPSLTVNLGRVSIGDETTAVVYATSSDRTTDAIAVQNQILCKMRAGGRLP